MASVSFTGALSCAGVTNVSPDISYLPREERVTGGVIGLLHKRGDLAGVDAPDGIGGDGIGAIDG